LTKNSRNQFSKHLAWNRIMGFFSLILFFIHFIKFLSAVEMSSSMQNFSPIKFFFCNRNSVFPVLKKTVSAKTIFQHFKLVGLG
jgi:hypothetical protein